MRWPDQLPGLGGHAGEPQSALVRIRTMSANRATALTLRAVAVVALLAVSCSRGTLPSAGGGSASHGRSPSAEPQPSTHQPSTGGSTGGYFACTLVIGFSQTGGWFKSGFESLVQDGKWELLTQSGGAIQLWADPGYSGWSQTIQSRCSSGPVDRVLLNIAGESGSRVENWVEHIQATIANIRARFPGVRHIMLQPVVGGPQHSTCTFEGQTVRASFDQPYIDMAISEIVGGAIVAGASPVVANCSQYQDVLGHLTPEGYRYVAQGLGEYYSARHEG